MLSKNSSASPIIALAQVVVEVGELERVGLLVPQVAQVQPLAGEVLDERVRLRIGQHAPHLLLEHRRLLQLAPRRRVEQLVVRNAAPQEERQPRRQLEVRRGDTRRPAATPAGSGSTRNRNFGLARMRRSAMSMPPSKRAGLARGRARRSRAAPAGRRRVTSPRYARRASGWQNLPRARRFVGGSRRRAAGRRCARRLGVSPGPVGLNGPVMMN